MSPGIPRVISTTPASALAAPSPTVLDIFVTWHPRDSDGEAVLEEVFDHYHSEPFAGLAGGAIEVYGRSAPAPGRTAPPPIMTRVGRIGDADDTHDGGDSWGEAAAYAVVLLLIGPGLVRASLEDASWQRYLAQLRDLQHSSSGSGPRLVHVLPVLPPQPVDCSRSGVLTEILGAQGLQVDHLTYGSRQRGHADAQESSAAVGRLTRDLSQAITQDLLSGPEAPSRLTVFVSHARGDVPHDDQVGLAPHGPVATIRALASRTRLGTFIDVDDLQAGASWDTTIRQKASQNALLMVRTDGYSCREWTQWEVLEAKKADVPIVCLSSLTRGEQRGSFLLDHVPTVAYPTGVDAAGSDAGAAAGGATVEPGTGPGKPGATSLRRRQETAVMNALNRLVDETLKRALWRRQPIPQDVERRSAAGPPPPCADGRSNNDGFDAAPVHPPEPLVLTRFLTEHKSHFPDDRRLWLLHPDPPLLPPEHDVMTELCALSGYDPEEVHLLTPRTFFAAGGTWGRGEPTLATPNLALTRPLAGQVLGISMALNEDLGSRGLIGRHLEAVVAELAQLMLLAGGGISYAGALGTHVPDVTAAVVNTVDRYVETAQLTAHRRSRGITSGAAAIHPGDMFSLTVPRMSLRRDEDVENLSTRASSLASVGRIRVLDEHGELLELDDAAAWPQKATPGEAARAFTAVRKALPHHCDARILLGGKTRPHGDAAPDGYRGVMPGIVEEALFTVRAHQPLFVAGGLGVLHREVVNGRGSEDLR
uniref:hypothetical protein n=1 Tax=Actinomyces radicidentis TaxID=111015 RepID=UPI0028F15BD7